MIDNIVVKWQNSYSVGIKLIDEQHMELIRLTNKLFTSCLAGQERSISIFLNTIHEAVDYTSYHFGTEEKIMERIIYPDYINHKKEHTEFVREVFTKVDEFKSGKIFTPLQFVYFLRDWVLHHIAVNDKKLGEYLLMMKRSGELQKMTLMVKKENATNRIKIL
jgi:hemerythrin-like metal-binding protein